MKLRLVLILTIFLSVSCSTSLVPKPLVMISSKHALADLDSFELALKKHISKGEVSRYLITMPLQRLRMNLFSANNLPLQKFKKKIFDILGIYIGMHSTDNVKIYKRFTLKFSKISFSL